MEGLLVSLGKKGSFVPVPMRTILANSENMSSCV